MPLIRSLDQMLEDLDRRQRPGPPSKNRPLQRYQSVTDVVAMSSDTTTTTVATPPYHWHDAAGSTATSLIWALSEWRA